MKALIPTAIKARLNIGGTPSTKTQNKSSRSCLSFLRQLPNSARTTTSTTPQTKSQTGTMSAPATQRPALGTTIRAQPGPQRRVVAPKTPIGARPENTTSFQPHETSESKTGDSPQPQRTTQKETPTQREILKRGQTETYSVRFEKLDEHKETKTLRSELKQDQKLFEKQKIKNKINNRILQNSSLKIKKKDKIKPEDVKKLQQLANNINEFTSCNLDLVNDLNILKLIDKDVNRLTEEATEAGFLVQS